MNLLLDVFLYAFWLVFAFRFTLALPWPASWKLRKPLSCTACTVGWFIIGLALYRSGAKYQTLFDGTLFILVAAGGLAVLLLQLQDYWRGAGLQPPE